MVTGADTQITDQLATFAAGLSLDQIPPEVVDRAKLLLLDCVGSIIRARHDIDSTPPLLAAVRALGLHHGTALVFGDPAGYAPAGAALLNATLAHSLDFDDTHAEAIMHVGATVFPAAWAAAELAGASGATFITGAIAGYEVAIRLALALPAGAHYDRGFHPSATCGAFGAAAATARVFGLDAADTGSAFGIALSQSAGSLQFLANGAWTKRFQVGWASMAGFVAATLAREGFVGAAAPIEGRHGFLRAYAPSPDVTRAVAMLGIDWETMRTGIKPYPSCRWGHAGIDAALALREEFDIDPATIECVELGLSRAGLMLIGEPLEQKQSPGNLVDAQFSGPFVLACALLMGRVGWDSVGQLQDPSLRALMARITCVHDPEIEAAFPTNMAGKVTITANGQNYTRAVFVPSGDPGNFPTVAGLHDKFMSLVESQDARIQPQVLAKRILEIDQLESLSELCKSK